MTAGAHAHAFYREVAKYNDVFTLGKGGVPMLVQGAAGSVLPVWSSRSRAEKIVANASGFSGLTILGMPWDEFEKTQVPQLERQSILLGINWGGKAANGYEVAPQFVTESVRSAREHEV
ncbi:MAG: DUF2750 domain-containing protein [Burkholderiales bacterium]|nr:DUF2750 domain-containing protein [Burkholderiales bacterium]